MDLLSLFAQATTEAPIPWVKTSGFAALALVVFVIISFLLGRFIAKSVQMSDHGWKLAVIFFSVIFSTYYVAMNWPPRFGVDLKGGVTFIVDLNLDNNPDKIAARYLQDDQDGDGKLSEEEFPENERRTFKRIDTNEDGFVTRDEIRANAIQQAKEDGQVKESVENVIDQLKKRIDPSGIYEVELRALGEDQIEITIPDVESTEATRIFERIKKAGLLQFRILAKTTDPEHATIIEAATAMANSPNPDLRIRNEVRDLSGSRVVASWVNVGRLDAKRAKALGRKNHPFRYTLEFNGESPNALIRNSATGELVNRIPYSPPVFKDKAAQTRFQKSPKLRAAFYADWWAENQMKKHPNAEMQILVVEPSSGENVEGQDLVPSLVRQSIDKTGRPAVEFTLKRKGVAKFSKLTGNNTGRALGMVLDGELLSAPNINSKIYKNGVIEGNFTSKEVQDLISILKAGQLKTTLQSPDGGGDLIDSTMGQEMKDKGFWAIGASFVLILVFLAIYYRIAGIVSCLALILNMLMILAIIMMLKQPLTLNGLAGLVLTVGMSVDANVLIFERIREELAKDATLRMAIRNGFQRATTTIVDANITTFITAFILYVIGNEQLKSFSVALMLGIILSMFTAIFCSRVLFDIFEKKRWLKSLGMTRFLTNTKVNFIGKRSLAFVVSLVFIGIGLGAIVYRNSSMLNHDLAGGSMARVVFAEDTSIEEVNKTLEKISQENEVNGAPAVISAAEVTSSLYPDNTYYRIVSNIKSNDGSKSLAELLTEGFKGKLATSQFDYKITDAPPALQQKPPQGNSNNGNSNSGDPSQQNSLDENKKNGDGSNKSELQNNGPENNEPENNEPVDPCGGGDFYPEEPAGTPETRGPPNQDEPTKTGSDKQEDPSKEDTTQVDPNKTEANKTTEKQTEPKTGESTPPQNSAISQGADPQGADPQKDDSKKEATPKTNQDDTTQKGNQIDRSTGFQSGQPQGGQSQGGQSQGETKAPSGIGIYKTVATINFGLNVKDAAYTKKAVSLKSDFEEVAKELNFDNYTRNNIKVRDPSKGGDFIGDDVKYESAVWEVEITTQGADHGQRILEAMKEKYNGQVFIPQAKEVGERFAQKAWLRAFAAMVASLIGIVAYIWIRFQRVSFGLAAVVALIHDVLVVLGAIAVSFWLKDYLGIILVEDFKISLAVIAALLTIIGYSLNDTIVVFDRIREVRGKNPEMNGEMINRSINQTLSRTILTSLTTFIVVVILYGAGGDAIHGFAFALVVGVIVGTYSSIFVASPVLLMLMKGETDVEETEAA